MVYVYAILAVILLIISLFLILPGRIQIILGGENFADVTLYFFGGLLKIPIDLKEKEKSQSKDKSKKKHLKSSEESDNEKADKNFFDGINNIFRIVNIIKKTYTRSRAYVRKRINADVTVNISFGLHDAALTGIATGAVWTLLYELLGLISTVALIGKHSFNVDPVFYKALFKADGLCIFRFRPVNIIGILIHVLLKYSKVKAEIDNVNTN